MHRDVKPGNVLIREDGVTKLADLGIATASDGTSITRSGTVLGTAGYMAPEQLDGRGAGPPADVYALAAISFEALSGKRPREGRTPVEIAHQIATEGAPDLRRVWPAAPTEVVRVLQRGMAVEPEDRPASAGEFASELADGARGRAGEDARDPTSARGRPSARGRHARGSSRADQAPLAAAAHAAAREGRRWRRASPHGRDRACRDLHRPRRGHDRGRRSLGWR